MSKLNLGIIGVLFPSKAETNVNFDIKSLNGKTYWLSWGSRYETLNKVCNYLYKNGYWNCTSKHSIIDDSEYFLFSSMKDFRFPLVFFHHDSKSQGGNGLIYYKYEIDKVIIAKNQPITIKSENLSYKPLLNSSKVWFGITRVKALEREGIDFGSFYIHSEILNKPSRQVDKRSDSAFLYYQVLPVIEPYHNDNDGSCNCLICR